MFEELALIDQRRLTKHAGQLWIAHLHLTSMGYAPEVGGIVRVGPEEDQTFYEIEAPAPHRLKGEPMHSPNVEGWWLREVQTSGWVPDAMPVIDQGPVAAAIT